MKYQSRKKNLKSLQCRVPQEVIDAISLAAEKNGVTVSGQAAAWLTSRTNFSEVYIPEDLIEFLDFDATELGISRAALLTKIVKEYVQSKYPLAKDLS